MNVEHCLIFFLWFFPDLCEHLLGTTSKIQLIPIGYSYEGWFRALTQ
jgi:hypothetical protein